MNVRCLHILILWAGFLLLGTSCEEAIDWKLQPGDNGQLVVEAILTNERRIQEIRLSRTYDELNGAVPPVIAAQVRVVANQRSEAFQGVPSEPGLYRSERPFAVLADLEYELQIFWEGKVYTARSTLSEVAPLPPITFQSFGRPDSLTFGDFVPLYNPNQEAFYEMLVSWSHLSGDTRDRAKLHYYTFNSIDVAGLVRPLRDTVFFPRGSIVLARKYGLNADYADFLQALLSETDWRGGAFYNAEASLPSNISNGAVGFFSTCAVVTDTVVAR